MSTKALHIISITPEPKSSQESSSTFLTAGTMEFSREIVNVCATLGIDPSELQPRAGDGGVKVAAETRLKHSEELRKAKLAVVQRELSRRKTAYVGVGSPRRNSPVMKASDLSPVLPISAVGLINHRLDYVSNRIDIARRVNENQAKLLEQQQHTHIGLLKTLNEKQKRSEEQRKSREREAREKAEAVRKHREELLTKMKSMQERREMEEVRKDRKSTTPRPMPTSFQSPSPLPAAVSSSSLQSSSLSPSSRSESDDPCALQLAQITEKLERSSRLAETQRNATKQMLRKKWEMVEAIRENHNKRAAEEETNRIREIERLKSSTEKHIKNREVRIQETIVRLGEEWKQKAERIKRETMRRNQQCRSLERTYNERESHRQMQIERSVQSKQQTSLEKAQKSDQRHELAGEYRELIHDLQVNERERMITRWRKAEQSLCEIREVRDRVRSFHEKATLQLREEKEKRLQSLSKGRKTPIRVENPAV